MSWRISRRSFIAKSGAVSLTLPVDLQRLFDPSHYLDPTEFEKLNQTADSPQPVYPFDSTLRKTASSQNPRVFVVPGKDYALAVNTLRHELADHLKHNAPYPIGRIFQLFPINAIEGTTSDQLIRRGSIKFTPTEALNTGSPIDATFGDQSLGRLSISLPSTLRASIIRNTDGSLAFDLSKEPVQLIFFDLDAKYRVLTNQSLTQIKFGERFVTYTFFATNAPDQQMRIDLDLRLDLSRPIATPALKPASFRLAADCQPGQKWTPGYVGPFKCDCCGSCNNDPSYSGSGSSTVLFPDCMCASGDETTWNAFFINNPFWTNPNISSAKGRVYSFVLSSSCNPNACGNMQEFGPGTERTLKVVNAFTSPSTIYKVTLVLQAP